MMRSLLTAKSSTRTQRAKRRGTIAVLTAMLMVPCCAMLAFALDYGYLLKTRAKLQRAADAAALAAVRDLVPASDGTQDLVTARATVRKYAALNLSSDPNFTVLDADIEIGRYDPTTVYSNFTILNSGTFDTVRVRLRRDTQVNSPVSLFFAPVLGINDCNVTVTATAVLQKASILEPGAGILPFSIPVNVWTATNPGDTLSVYGDGKLEDNFGFTLPGNWGTLDIGSSNNSTSDLRDQILNGLRQKDLDALYAANRIPTDTHIDSTQDFYANADPGLSSGMKSAVQAVHGTTKLIPIYDPVTGGGGNNVEFHVVGWAVCEVVDSHWGGAKNTYVRVKKSFTYDGFLKPQTDLSITTALIDGAFTYPVLVE